MARNGIRVHIGFGRQLGVRISILIAATNQRRALTNRRQLADMRWNIADRKPHARTRGTVGL